MKAPSLLLPLPRDLMAEFRAGERRALRHVYEAHVDQVERSVRHQLRRLNGAVAESDVADLVQDIFIKAFSSAARQAYDGIRDYAPYLAVITRNAIVDWFRRRRRDVLLDTEDLSGLSDRAAHAQSESLEDQGPQGERKQLTAQYLAGLPPELRGVHHQRFVLGVSQDTCAETLGLTRQRVRTLEHKLVEGLRRFLRQRQAP